MFQIFINLTSFNLDSMLEKFILPVFSIKQIIFIIFVSFIFLIAFFIILSRDVIYCLLGLIFLYVVLMVNLKGYEIRESIFYKFNISSFLLSLLFLVSTIYLTRDDIQAYYILDKVNTTEDEYGIPIVRYINVFDVIYRSFNSPLKL